MGRGDLTDEQGAVLEPLSPKRTKAGRPPVWRGRRQLIDGIRFRVRTGAPWRDVPVQYGPWGRSTTCSAGGSETVPGTGPSPASRPWPTRTVPSGGA
ncbi:transposase [Streptomyces sp. NPDC018007]|uniref:transposase n=1 Tax=Streptomyces sp. NPDC018007 TaxID=3365029 RepID=UPI003793B914